MSLYGHSPCLDCEERHVGCHSVCERYGVFAAKVEKLRDKNTRDAEKISTIVGYMLDSHERATRSHKI